MRFLIFFTRIVLLMLGSTFVTAQTFTAQLLSSGTGGTFPALTGTLGVGQISGHYGYFAHSSYGLVVADVADPLRPLPITLSLPYSSGAGVTVADKRAYLASSDDGVFIFDVTSPGRPYLLGQFTNNIKYASDPLVRGNRLYFLDNANGVRALDVSDATHPIEKFSLLAIDSIDEQNGVLVALRHSTTAGVGNVYFLNPETGAFLANPIPIIDGWSVKLVSNLLYVSCQTQGFKVFDVSQLSTPKLLASYRSPNLFTDFDVKNGIVFHGMHYSPLTLGDWSNSVGPNFVELSTFADPLWVRVSGGRLLLGNGAISIFDLTHFDYTLLPPVNIPQLAILDTRQPTVAPSYTKVVTAGTDIAAVNPFRIELYDATNVFRKGSCPLPIAPIGFAANAWVGVAACGEGGLSLIQMFDSWELMHTERYTTAGPALAVAMRDFLAVVAEGTAGLEVFDVSAPGPVRRSVHTLPGPALAVSTSASLASVSCGETGVALLEILDDGTLRLLSVFNTQGFANATLIRDNYLYIADGNSGLAIADISNPLQPAFLGACPAPSPVLDVCLSGNVAIVAAGNTGIHAMDIADPKNPQLLASLKSGLNALSVASAGPKLSTADEGGLYRSALRTSPRIVVCNPANGRPVSIGDTLKLSWRTDSVTNSVWPIQLISASGSATEIITDMPFQKQDGGWSANWKVSAPVGCNYTIRVANQSGTVSGTSAEFCIGEAASTQVAATMTGNSVSISWDATLISYHLISAPSPTGPWTLISNSQSTVGAKRVFETAANATAVFYRLEKTP